MIRAIEGDILGTTVKTGFTVASSVKVVIHNLALTNFSPAADTTVSVYLVPKGQTAQPQYKVASDLLIYHDQTKIVHGAIGQVLHEGGTIQYIADVPNSVTAVCSGIEVST